MLTGRLPRHSFHEQFEATGCRIVAVHFAAIEIEIPAVQLQAARGDRLLHERKLRERRTVLSTALSIRVAFST